MYIFSCENEISACGEQVFMYIFRVKMNSLQVVSKYLCTFFV